MLSQRNSLISKCLGSGVAGLALIVIAFAASTPADAGVDVKIQEAGERAFLGVHMGHAHDEGVKVKRVVRDSAAEDAGLRSGDVIIGIDRNSIDDRTDLSAVLADYRPDDRVRLRILRDDEVETLDVVLGGKWSERRLIFDEPVAVKSPKMRGRIRGSMTVDDDTELDEIFFCPGEGCAFQRGKVWFRGDCLDDGCPTYRVRFYDRPMLGVEIESVNAELGRFFGGDGEGVLISKVLAESPAEHGGVEVGDLIIGIDGDTIRDRQDLRRALAGTAGTRFDLEVIRDRRTISIVIDMPD